MLIKTAGHACAVIVLLAAFLLLTTRRVSSEPYVYDEADYIYAGSLGFIANWTDTPALSLVSFLSAGISLGKDARARQDLSEFVRQSNDVTFYRHWHGPLFSYLLIPLSHTGLGERGVRMAMLTVPMASLVAVFLGCLWLLPGLRGFLAAALAGTVFLSSYAVTASSELAPHHLLTFFSLCCLFLLAKSISTGRRTYWYGCVLAAAAAFCTLEIALVLIVTVAICGYAKRRRFRADRKFAARSSTLFLTAVFALWPAAILKLSFVKSYLGIAYLAFSRTSPWGSTGFLDTWKDRFLASPLEWGIILLGVILYFRGRPKNSDVVYPILTYGLLSAAATLPVLSVTPRYSLVFMPELDIVAGLVLAAFVKRPQRPANITALSVLIIGTYAMALHQSLASHPSTNPRSAAVLLFIHQNHLDDKALLVPKEELPMIHYYFPTAKLRGYVAPYPELSDRSGFRADAILSRSYPVDFELVQRR